MQTCHCGRCSWCEAKRDVLRLGAQRCWETYQVSPCTWIAKGEDYWRIFIDTHEESELRSVSRGEYQSV